MKIVSIITSATNKNTITLETEPPATEEVHKALSSLLRHSTFGSVSLVGDHLTASPKQLPDGPKDIQLLSKWLTEAEENVEKEKKEAEEARDKFLQDLSRKLGLPLK